MSCTTLPATPVLGLQTLASLISAISELEMQWIYLRADPGRVSLSPQSQADYLRTLHHWYTIDMPRDKAALLTRINDLTDIEGAGGVRASLTQKCWDACEQLEQLEQLEVVGNVHVYFVGGPRTHVVG